MKKKELINTPGLIVKGNSLIEARCKFDVYEARILAWCTAQIGRYDDDFTMYKLKRSDAVKLLGFYENISIKRIRELLKKMHRHVIEIKDPKLDMGKEGWIDVSLITRSQYNSNTEEFWFRIHEDLKPFLLQLTGGNFTKLDFMTILQFKNAHTVRFYEICRKELMQNSEVLFHRDLEEFKATLGIPGKYKKYPDFKLRILDPVIEELRNIADMELEVIASKMGGKKFVSLQFEVKMIDPRRSGYWLQMRSFGLADKKISELLTTYGREIIDETLRKCGSQLTAKQFKNGTAIDNPAGVFLTKLKEVASNIGVQTFF